MLTEPEIHLTADLILTRDVYKLQKLLTLVLKSTKRVDPETLRNEKL